PCRRFCVQPVPDAGGAPEGRSRRRQAEARPGPAPAAQRLRRAGGGGRDSARARTPRRGSRGTRGGRGGTQRSSRPSLRCVHALQARRVGAVPGRRHRLGAGKVLGRAPLMCGIAGIIYRNGDGEHAVGHDMTAMLQSMKHRGPDSTGYALYGPASELFIMRYKLADANDPRDLEFAQRLEHHKAEVEARLRMLGARIHEIEKETGYAYRVTFEYAGELKAITDVVEDVPHVEVLSLGHSLEIIKDLGDAEQVAKQYSLDGFVGTHAIGHVRMATESDVYI